VIRDESYKEKKEEVKSHITGDVEERLREEMAAWDGKETDDSSESDEESDEENGTTAAQGGGGSEGEGERQGRK
jgi:hypothetical protein